MLQDLPGGRLLNEFRNPEPKAEDIVVCFRENAVIIHRDTEDALRLPTVNEIAVGVPWGKKPLQYIFPEREMIYYGKLSSPQGIIYYVSYNDKLGYVKESNVYPFGRVCGRTGAHPAAVAKQGRVLCGDDRLASVLLVSQ